MRSHRMTSGRKRHSLLNRSSESAQLMYNDAANQFYDKNIGRAFDKYNAQECHQRRLVEIRESGFVRKVNYERLTSGSGRSVSVASNKKFQDNLKRNQVNHRVFNIKEQRNYINYQNEQIFNRLQEIHKVSQLSLQITLYRKNTDSPVKLQEESAQNCSL